MRPREEKRLEKALGLFADPPPDLMDSARERVRQRLNASQSDQVTIEETDWARPERRSGWAAYAAMAAAIAIAVFIPAVALRSAPAVFEDASGARKIGYGEVIVPRGSSGVLRFPDGARVELRKESELTVVGGSEGIRVQLTRGDIIVSPAQPPSAPVIVETKDLSVVGKEFLVNSEEAGSRVASLGGEVRVQQGATEWKLQPGRQLSTNPQLERLSLPQELSWSQNAEALAAVWKLTTPQEKLATFEVSSVRPVTSGPRGASGPLQYPCNGPGPQVGPGRFSVPYVSLYRLIAWAYAKRCDASSRQDLITGGPDWVRSQPFAVDAIIPSGSPVYTTPQLLNGQAPQLQEMLQNLLAERFKLTLRRETRGIDGYDLVVAKDNGRLALSADQTPVDPSTAASNTSGRGTVSFVSDRAGNATLSANAVSISKLLEMWMPMIDRPLRDRTNLPGLYDIAPFRFTLQQLPFPVPGTVPVAAPADPGRSQISQILEQLGLRLEETRAPGEILVIDHVERPSEN
jgi:uncharacterized protein (TIGR03435 family)